MRASLACLAAFALLAGCSAPASPGNDADPANPTPTDPGAGDPGRGGPDGDGQDGGPDGGDGMAPMLIPPAHAENESQGLRLVGDQDSSGMADGESVTFTFNATNVGADAITWGGCYRPFAYSLKGPDGEPRELQPMMAHCLGFTEDPFPAGASLVAATTWNGTYADGEGYVRAEPGVHEFTATFTAMRGDGWDERVLVTVTLPVTVLPPNAI